MRIAIISDIHANLEALQVVINDIKKKQIDAIFCLGDVVGYGEQPVEVIELLKKHKVKCVMGNHDEAFVEKEQSLLFQEERTFNKVSIDRTSMEFIESLPLSISHNNLLFVHGMPPDSNLEYVNYSNPLVLQMSMSEMKESLAFVGHSHQFGIYESFCGYIKNIAFTNEVYQLSEHKTIVNIGSVGFSRDGDPRPAYAIYDDELHAVIKRRVN
ncbi:MAG: metallophosphoesterase family protein [Salinivirgaceae bacterium]|nr:metallophosphoesterase family protein [Salinivirgaceae bacterium]